MNIVLIDNGTEHISKFKKLLSVHELRIIPNSMLLPNSVDGAHAVILSGGKNFSVKGNDVKLKMQMNLIRTVTCPLLGVCFGAELIAYTFGGTLSRRPEKITGPTFIHTLMPDTLYKGIEDFRFYSSHRWVVSSLKDPLDVLATSVHGIEIFKHREKKVYGVQFHPELSLHNRNGEILLKNFLRVIE